VAPERRSRVREYDSSLPWLTSTQPSQRQPIVPSPRPAAVPWASVHQKGQKSVNSPANLPWSWADISITSAPWCRPHLGESRRDSQAQRGQPRESGERMMLSVSCSVDGSASGHHADTVSNRPRQGSNTPRLWAEQELLRASGHETGRWCSATRVYCLLYCSCRRYYVLYYDSPVQPSPECSARFISGLTSLQTVETSLEGPDRQDPRTRCTGHS
jgi:hypothetical protein